MSDQIFIHHLEAPAIIGIYDDERVNRQTVRISLRLPADARAAAGADEIAATTNYKDITDRIESLLASSRFKLVESLAEKIADVVLNEFDQAWVEVSVGKPQAIGSVENIGVRIRRGVPSTPPPHRVYVALGSNIDAVRHVRVGLADLEDAFGALRQSAVYRCPAVGFEGEDFLNLVVGFRTSRTAGDVLATLHSIENRYDQARPRSKFVPRTLDLDLLTYGDAVVTGHGLHLPRTDLLDYAYLLRPLAELAGDDCHPVTSRPYADHWRRFAGKQIEMTPIVLEENV